MGGFFRGIFSWHRYNANIKLTDKNEIIQNYEKVTETLNSFFENAVSSLKLNENSFVINNEHKNIQEPIEKIIVKFSPQYFNYQK